jgi:hypothetical protein
MGSRGTHTSVRLRPEVAEARRKGQQESKESGGSKVGREGGGER